MRIFIILSFSVLFLAIACSTPGKLDSSELESDKTINDNFLGDWIRKDYIDTLKKSPTLIDAARFYMGLSNLNINKHPEKSFYGMKFNEGDKCIYEVLDDNQILIRNQYSSAKTLFTVILEDSSENHMLAVISANKGDTTLLVRYPEEYTTLRPPYELVNEIFIAGEYLDTETNSVVDFSTGGSVTIDGVETSRYTLGIAYCSPPFFDWIKFESFEGEWLHGMYHMKFHGDTLTFFNLEYNSDGMRTISTQNSILIRRE